MGLSTQKYFLPPFHLDDLKLFNLCWCDYKSRALPWERLHLIILAFPKSWRAKLFWILAPVQHFPFCIFIWMGLENWLLPCILCTGKKKGQYLESVSMEWEQHGVVEEECVVGAAGEVRIRWLDALEVY